MLKETEIIYHYSTGRRFWPNLSWTTATETAARPLREAAHIQKIYYIKKNPRKMKKNNGKKTSADFI